MTAVTARAMCMAISSAVPMSASEFDKSSNAAAVCAWTRASSTAMAESSAAATSRP
jgi:hypothetical protein